MRRRVRIAVAPGDSRKSLTVYRVWPHDTLRIGEWYDVWDRRKFHSARNSAYQYGKRCGKRFMCYPFGRHVLRIERVE